MTVSVALNQETARNALRQVKDPELDMNIIDLGLVYDVEVAGGEVRVKMTLTSPGCPAGPMITNDAYRVLCGRSTLEAVARTEPLPNDRAGLARVGELRRWQIDVLGDALLGALG